MSTSGSINFSQTRNDLIKDALTYIGCLGVEDTLGAEDLNFANRQLDKMIKAWQGQGIGIWSKTEATILLTSGVAKYQLGGSNPAKASDTVVETTTTAAASLGASTVVVASVSGMTIGDNIGIVLTGGTIQWTTITNIATLTITLGVVLTGAAASGNRIYTYTTALNRPLDVTQIRIRDNSDNDRDLGTQLAREDYFALTNKTTPGTPNAWYYDPQLVSGFIYLYPTPDSVNLRAKITYRRTLEDFDAAPNTPDFPQEWLLAITLNLAVVIAPAYGKETKVAQGLGAMANYAFSLARSLDVDAGSVFLAPSSRDHE